MKVVCPIVDRYLEFTSAIKIDPLTVVVELADIHINTFHNTSTV